MSEQDVTEYAEDLYEDLDTDVIDIDIESLEERFEKFKNFDVPLDSARETILNNLAEEEGVETSEILEEGSSGGGFMYVEDIDDEGPFIDVEVEVTELWDNDTDAIEQVGLVHDNTGRIKFKSWSKSELPLLTEGQSYRLENVARNEYNGRMELSLNSNTEIEMIDESFEPPDNTESFFGVFVKMHDGSGLIRRCSMDDCNRVLDRGQCKEHGDVEGEFDLRVRGVLDSGKDSMNVNFDKEMTEMLSEIPLEEAQNMAESAFDTSVVGDEIKDVFTGRYFEVEGWVNDRNTLYVQEAEIVEETEKYDVDEMIVRVDALEQNDAEFN